MTGDTDFVAAARLYLERTDGEVFDCNEAARELLGLPAAEPVSGTWWSILGVPPASEAPLAHAIRAGVRASLPPTLLCPAHGEEIVVGGYLFLQLHRGREMIVLQLFRLTAGVDQAFAAAMTSSDVLVVLGVDRLGGDSQWQASNIARRMMDIRAGLLQIVPTGDGVGLPVGATVPIVLRDVTVEAAQDISRALLSHLSPLLAGYEEGAVHARICIGLAQVKQGHSPLAAIMAANNALLLLQQGNGDELIAVAEERDEQLLAARAINADGIFSENHSPAQTCAYLADLTRLDADPLHPGNYLAAVVALTLRQPDVAAVGVYRRSHDDSYDYVAGGLEGAGEPGQEQGEEGLAESRLPRALREQRRKLDTVQLRERECITHPGSRTSIFPLKLHNSVLGYLALHYQQSADPLRPVFIPDIAALHYLATELSTMTDWRQAREDFTAQVLPPVQPIDYQLDGYVDDNLEGAIDQAVFLSRVDVPVAVIGPRGTGKLYVAKVIHQEAGAPPEMLVAIDCRGFRSRKEALSRIARELERSAEKTLVFKSPHLLNPDVQLKLARQISSRILADTSPPRYVPAARFVALFPDNLEHLVQHGGLNEKLASVFAGYPILVPPIRDRKRAVLRWAHKILAQEAVRRDRKIKGFTPDAEQAMLRYEWPGNISEMRQTIASALDKTDKEWITPVDLGLFKGISPGQAAGLSDKRPFLQSVLDEVPEEQAYTPTGLDELGVALGEALHSMLELDSVKPLGAWLDDEVVLAVCERYRGNMPGAAQFLHTRARNISRWMPKIVSRDHDRNASSLWQVPRRLIKQWLKETAPLDEAPLQVVQAILMSHVVRQCESMGVADRARIMGVYTNLPEAIAGNLSPVTPGNGAQAMSTNAHDEQPTAQVPGVSPGDRRTVQDYAEEYQRLADTHLPVCLGFSARLNMLWDLAGAAPAQTEGRVLGIMGINSAWRESDVRNWLQKDVLPSRLDLHNVVKFLVTQLQDSQNARRWEAFLIYGSPIVSSPVNNSMYRDDKARREIASMIFAQVTAEYAIPPSAYDADRVFQRCLTLMQKFNIYELNDFQSGHLEPFRNYLFPSE